MIKFFILLIIVYNIAAFPQPTTWIVKISKSSYRSFNAILFNDTTVRIKISCTNTNNAQFAFKWVLRSTDCPTAFQMVDTSSISSFLTSDQLLSPETELKRLPPSNEDSFYNCSSPIVLKDQTGVKPKVVRQNGSVNISNSKYFGTSHSEPDVVAHTWQDGSFILVLKFDFSKGKPPDVPLTLEVSYKSPKGYLSAIDYPLLMFYLSMSFIYIVFSCVWLFVCAKHWKDLLRVQYWIGGVIALGLVENALLFGEYEHLNSNGVLIRPLEMLAEAITVSKRTLARMLVVVMSLGFGIVKPRLGNIMKRVWFAGAVYFVAALAEGAIRIYDSRGSSGPRALIALIPLSVIDAIICWWIFTSLMATLRALRLRRNLVKLTLYRHFTNILGFSVVATVIFFVWSYKAHRYTICDRDWTELWIDDAFWRLLFSLVLFVIIILWRPSQNNQRYAFSPLMDNEDDEMEEEPMMLNENFADTVRARGTGNNYIGPKTHDATEDETLRWVEDHIPTAGIDTALPSLLDSDEEVMTTKLEMSKMM